MLHVRHGEIIAEKGLRVHVHPDARKRTASQIDLAHTRHLGYLLCEHTLGHVVHLVVRDGLGGERQDQDGRACRVHLAVGGVGGHGGKRGPCRIDGSLHIAGSTVDVAVKLELQDDVAGSLRASRGHLRDTRNAPQGPFKGCCNRGCHDLGACARKARADNDHRKVHFRQGRHRQGCEGNASCKGYGYGQKRCRNRAPYKGG